MAEGGPQFHLHAGEKPVCDLCKEKLDNQLSKCLDCDLYICDKCCLTHKQIPATKNHNIISRVEPEPRKISKISRMCSSHQNEEVMYFCSMCKILICSECITGNHKKHECTKIATFAKKKRQDLKTCLDKVKNMDVPQMKSKIDKIKETSKLNDEKRNKNLQKLKNRKLLLVAELERVNLKIEFEYDKIYRMHKGKLATVETKLTQDISEIETMCSDFTQILHTGSDLEVIIAEQEIFEKLQNVKSLEIDAELHLPTFIEGKTDHKMLKTMYGSLQPGWDPRPVSTIADVKIINQFNHRSTLVQSICPLTDNTALINYECFAGKYFYEYDIVSVYGEYHDQWCFEFKVFDFIMTSQEEIMSSSFIDEPIIYKLTKDGVITDTINTAPLLPGCLCESGDGNLLVGLVDKKSYKINNSSRRCVSRVTMKGKILESYEYDKGSRLFTMPSSVSENINGDVCIVNRTSRETGHLVILDSSGRLKFTNIKQQMSEEFNPVDVKCDKLGHVIVTNYKNTKVYMFDSESRLMGYIITENDLKDCPVSMAIDKKTGILWVGGHQGHIYTIKYTE